MLQTNTILPQTIARVCFATNTPLGHVSSGSIYSGAKIVENGGFRVEEDLGLPAARALFASHRRAMLCNGCPSTRNHKSLHQRSSQQDALRGPVILFDSRSDFTKPLGLDVVVADVERMLAPVGRIRP